MRPVTRASFLSAMLFVSEKYACPVDFWLYKHRCKQILLTANRDHSGENKTWWLNMLKIDRKKALEQFFNVSTPGNKWCLDWLWLQNIYLIRIFDIFLPFPATKSQSQWLKSHFPRTKTGQSQFPFYPFRTLSNRFLNCVCVLKYFYYKVPSGTHDKNKSVL